VSTDWKKCSKCGTEFPKIAMIYCKYCNAFFCRDCSLIHPDMENSYDEEHEYETEDYEHSYALADEDDDDE